MPVVAIGSLKTAGSTTLALTLSIAAAAGGMPVRIVDAARDRDLAAWAAKPGRPEEIEVLAPETGGKLMQAIREGNDAGMLTILDAGTKPEILRFSRRVADLVLIPVRFSPLSTFAAVTTDRLLAPESPDEADVKRAFVATAIAQIPSRIARIVEENIAMRETMRLPAGLCVRAAYEAPFLHGGTIFTLNDAQAPGLKRAQTEAIDVMTELTAVLGHSALTRLSAAAFAPAARERVLEAA